MTESRESGTTAVRAKAKYHHGDLREALIVAARQLVKEAGADSFSLADACRLAGVSTAAPYRHFKDREEIVAEVTARGFQALTTKMKRAVAKHGEGTQAAIIAIGQAYVAFAAREQGLFRHMFGRKPSVIEFETVSKAGGDCFGYLIEQVTIYCRAKGIERDTMEIAVELWTFVHGAASLLIDGKYDKVTPGLKVNEMIATATPLLLGRQD